MSVSVHAADYVEGELLVKLKGQRSSQSTSQFLQKASFKFNSKASLSQSTNIHHFALKPGLNMKAALEELRADPNVDYAEPNYILRKSDDNIISEKMSLEDLSSMGAGTVESYVQSRAAVGVQNAWTLVSESLSDRPIVAIIDTGIDFTHPVFVNSQALWANPGEIVDNGIDDDGNGFIDDVYGWNFAANTNSPFDDDDHGTHVAGIVLGAGQDILLNPIKTAKIRIMALKFLGADGSGTTADAIRAVNYAVRMGASVINNSWGGTSYSQALHDALSEAYSSHLAIASAAGNAASNNDSTSVYPAVLPVPSNLSIAATTDADALASFSNFGTQTTLLASPGVSILSTIPGNRYRYMSGTSMATPLVSGVLALMKREAPNLTGYQLSRLVLESSQMISGITDKVQGGRRLQADTAISLAKNSTGVSADQPSYKPSAADARAPASVEASSGGSAQAGCGMVATQVAKNIGSNSSLQGGGDSSNPWINLILAFSLVPYLAWFALRKRIDNPADRRQHERFLMESEIKINVGGRELVGNLSTISAGGVSFSADAMLDKGGIITMMIASPDGKEQLQVQGCVVWNAANHSYGVQFNQVVDQVNAWSLAKARTDVA